jgi:putative spermidine/putrescine transport system ATP-binding protein
MARLELRSVTKRFGTLAALDDVTLVLESGEFFSMLGPSGCGKTTALRIVAGFEIPDAGQVLLDDVDITGVPPNKRDMGMVFQAYSLFPNLTARENVEFGLRVRGRGQTDRATRANELLELVGLGQHGDRYSHQLSGGQQQRVALARALAIQPRVLLMDEPLSALDAQVRVQLREEIRRIQTELGITALYVTHDQEEALSISDRVAVMARGRPEQIGVPAEIYREPATPFVAEFVGTTNRFEATVVEGSAVLHEGNGLSVTAANGRPKGQRILVLVRPESLSVIAAGDGGATSEGGLAASVTAQVFLGPVTRLKMITPDGTPVAADVSSAAAARFQVGDSVIARFDADDARVLDLPAV